MLKFIAIAAAIVLLCVIFGPKGRPKRQTVVPQFSWPELDVFGTEVVGENSYQPALKAIAGDKRRDYEAIPVRAILIPEDSNPHDKNAVRVDVDSMTVGYLSRANAKRYRAALAKTEHGLVPAECAAAITGGFLLDSGKQASFGVVICVPPLE